MQRVFTSLRGIGVALVAVFICSGRGSMVNGIPAGDGQVALPTTNADYFQPGTQPEPDQAIFEPIHSSTQCEMCHGEYMPDPESHDEAWDGWLASAMGQSARDPLWRAVLAGSNLDAVDSGEFCIRCHAPTAWLGGRSMPADASGFESGFLIDDFNGVNCHFCHRLVDPVYAAGNPQEDIDILDGLAFPPGSQRGNGRYVVDPVNVRRGPYEDIALNPEMNIHGNDVDVLFSPFHRKSEMCGTCHDVLNPLFMRQPDGSYALTPLDEEHPTQDPYDMFPEQMTYSEWLYSDFATDGVYFPDGRFGGNHPTGVMSECQDCHMPDQMAGGCFAWEFPPFFERPDIGQHTFLGANTWVLQAVRALYDDSETGLNEERVEASVERNIAMLRAAADLESSLDDDALRVRVTNWSGHKLPTGFPEGRRMWLNIRFLGPGGTLVEEIGGYDYTSAVLDTTGTRIYQTIMTFDETVAAEVNLPAGTHFHLSLNNVIEFDNRIPPVGYTYAGYDEFGGAPVGQAYADGQHWDELEYEIPIGAVEAVITLWYQSLTREYVEYLAPLSTAGAVLETLWQDDDILQRVPPLDMNSIVVALAPPATGDLNGDGVVNFSDLVMLLSVWGDCGGQCPADLDGDGDIDFIDLLILLNNWS